MRAAAELRALGHGWVNVAEQMEQECSKVEGKLAAAREAAETSEATHLRQLKSSLAEEASRYNTLHIPCTALYKAAGLLHIERFTQRAVMALDMMARTEQTLWLSEGFLWKLLLPLNFMQVYGDSNTNADFAKLLISCIGTRATADDEKTILAGGFLRTEKEIAECLDDTLGVDFSKLHELFKKQEAKEKAYDTLVSETIETGY